MGNPFRKRCHTITGFQRVLRTHQPPHFVQAEPAPRFHADVNMPLMSRVEGAAEYANPNIAPVTPAWRVKHCSHKNLWAHGSGSTHFIFERRQLFDADGATGVEFSGCDSDFRSHSEFAAISKLCRRVMHDDCAR